MQHKKVLCLFWLLVNIICQFDTACHSSTDCCCLLLSAEMLLLMPNCHAFRSTHLHSYTRIQASSACCSKHVRT